MKKFEEKEVEGMTYLGRKEKEDFWVKIILTTAAGLLFVNIMIAIANSYFALWLLAQVIKLVN